MSLGIRPVLRSTAVLAFVGTLAGPGLETAPLSQSQGSTARSFAVVASRYTFAPARIEVFQDDLVTIELRTDDIAHSLTIDDYRVSKRVSPGQTVSFEFRAERTGTFPFYCDLKAEDGCRAMRGTLIVKPRP
jgi:nitrous-oxide reductase